LFLNKLELFLSKIMHLDVKSFFLDYKGKPGDMATRLDCFKNCFRRLAQETERLKEHKVST
jgi:hypothetical protein